MWCLFMHVIHAEKLKRVSGKFKQEQMWEYLQ